MITLAQLAGADRLTYGEILAKPTAKTVRRRDLQSLLSALAQVAQTRPDQLQVNRNGHVLILPARAADQFEPMSEVVAVRRFLKRSEISLPPVNGREAHLLLVIGHHEARLFCSDICGGATRQLLPDDGIAAFTIAAPDRIRTDLETPDPDLSRVFEPIAEALRVPGNILIFGESSASQLRMDSFVDWLKRRHPDQAERIVGSAVLAEDRLASGLLLAKARVFFAHERSGTTSAPFQALPPVAPGQSLSSPPPATPAMKTRSTSAQILTAPTEEQIRDYAFHLYEQHGCRAGHDVDDWLEATAALQANSPALRSPARQRDRAAVLGGPSIPPTPFTSRAVRT